MSLRGFLLFSIAFGLFANPLLSQEGQKKEHAKQEHAKKEQAKKIHVQQQHEKKNQELNKEVLAKVEKALSGYEKQLGKDKIKSILGNVKSGLEGKQNRFEFKVEGVPGDMKKHIELLKSTRDRIQEHGKAMGGKPDRKILGVMLNPDVKDGIGLQGVIEKSPADKAGLKEGDRIVKINGKSIKDYPALTDAVAKSKGTLKIMVMRDGKKMEVVAKPESAAKVPGMKKWTIQNKGGDVEEFKIELDGLDKFSDEFHFGDVEIDILTEDVKKTLKEKGIELPKIEKLLKSGQQARILLVQPDDEGKKVVRQRVELNSSLKNEIKALQNRLEKLEAQIKKMQSKKK